MNKCTIKACDSKAAVKDLCSSHYAKKRRHGDPEHSERESHGMYGTPEYNSWARMKSRCNDKNNTAYNRYGGRGIKVCRRWELFSNFYEDMGNRPADTTLDRINNDGNYEPNNCRWATWSTQNLNKKLQKNNTSGYKNVHKMSGGGWRVRKNVFGKTVDFGYFSTLDEAALVSSSIYVDH